MTDTIKTWQERSINNAGWFDTKKAMQAEIDELRAALAQQAEQVHDGNTFSNCTFHYKDIDMKPCSNCERGDNIEDNWMPMSTGQIALAAAPKGGV